MATRGASLLSLALLLSPLGASAQAAPPTTPGSAKPSQAAPGAAPATASGRRTSKLSPALLPKVSLAVSPDKGLVTGDVVTVRISAQAKRGVDVAVPEQSLAPFEVLDRRARTEPAGDEQRFVFELDLLALEPGTLTVPALALRVVGPNGELEEISTEARTVQVKSLLANEPNAKPKPATGPVSVIEDDYTLAWVLGGLLAAASIAALTWFVARWHARRPKAPPPPPPPRPAWEVALDKLEQLKRRQEQLLSAERGEEFVDGVSDALREYLGHRYGFEGLESTTDEILRTLERMRPHKLSLSGVSLLLEQCDLVKFARATPDEEQCDDLWNGAVGLVRSTTPAVTEQRSAETRS